MINALKQALKRVCGDRRGASAVEFALIAPFMILLYLGAVEISLALSIDRKITSAASALADLVAQDDVITDGEMADIMNAGGVIIAPFNTAPLQVRITSVLMNGSDDVRVQWSDAVGMTAYAAGGSAPVPAGVLQRNRSVIMVEVKYRYDTMFSELGVSQFDISEVFYLRPRQSIVVARS
ncbi:TadE/TadG family type IV pilus assembly protein [Maricaulis salignorans]|uniref:Flp pilus assembly protein TadG n=1 Tax=Maricaulis salignorans TaxID=144026 RepID=A0A1G9NEQ6_9PROT|nr:TadE/TadG family type IV pilus assembly protein [Maricaulis salignorans]SDL84972.1 Flp pilus assembly protein TadG [Maricaulis salignorans]